MHLLSQILFLYFNNLLKSMEEEYYGCAGRLKVGAKISRKKIFNVKIKVVNFREKSGKS